MTSWKRKPEAGPADNWIMHLRSSLLNRCLLTAALATACGGLASADIFHFIDSPPHPEPGHWTWRSTPPNGSYVTVYYFIDQSGSGGAFSSAEIDRIHDAAATWDFSSSGSALYMQEVFSAGPNRIRIVKEPIDGAGGLIGDTFVSFVGDPPSIFYPDGDALHQITSATIKFEGVGYTVYTGTGAPPGGSMDFQSVMTHNLGHALGLGDASGAQPSSVMNHVIPGENNDTLSMLDMAAIQHIYGNPEPTTLALFGVGLGMLGVGRRRRRQGGANKRLPECKGKG